MPHFPLPEFDVREIPFSSRGSWMDLSPVIGLHLQSDDIHLVSHVTGMHPVFSIVPTREGERVESTLRADPAVLTWECGREGEMRAAFESITTVRISGRGADITIADAAAGLTPFTGTYMFEDPVDGSHVFTSYETGRRYRITVLEGRARTRGSQALGLHDRSITVSGVDGWDVAIEEFEAVPAPYIAAPITEVIASTAEDFRSFADAIGGATAAREKTFSLAAYVLWSATVSPAGFLPRESILMSKHWMDKLWSWDHAFNAVAVAPGEPGLALDQFLAPFDHQDGAGALPDSITHSEVLYNFVKPPIHGWALTKLRLHLARSLSVAELMDIYERLSRWTRFWIEHRTVPGHALPHYQHGNDSGWDNSSTFDLDRVIEAPDLAAFLVVQLDVLAGLADELHVAGGAAWRQERDRIRTALLEQLWDGDGFFAEGALSGAPSKRTSLLNLLPVVASEHLPEHVRDALASGIEGHLTDWGLATQRVGSPEYESDGYWRGPIWAPSTMLVEDGLRRGGFTQLADQVSARFRALCEQSGFAENFDAVTGAGLRDRAYTWTASVYLTFVREAAMREAASLTGAAAHGPTRQE